MNDEPDLSGFDGTVRLFPLPNVVLFPGAVLPLHIFEPRYRQMTADALAGDQRITMARLRDGWEDDYAGRPPIDEVACLGQVLASQRRPDGRYDLLLLGAARVRVLEEIAADTLYRVARAELLCECGPCPAEGKRLLADLAQPSIACRSAQISTIQALIAQGLGVSLLPDMARRADAAGGKAYRLLTGGKPTRTVAAVWHRHRYHSRAAESFLDTLRTLGADRAGRARRAANGARP